MKKKLSICWLAAGLFSFGGCSSTGTTLDYKNNHDADLLEALFRYQFTDNLSSLKSKADAFCLKFEGLTLGDDFLRRFESERPRVFESNDCPAGKVVVFRVFELRRVSESVIHAYGGYYEGNVSSAENKYTLMRNETTRRWTVTKRKLLRLS